MKFKSFVTLSLFLILSINLSAHKGGHHAVNPTNWTINNEEIKASFLAFKKGQVFLETITGEILVKELTLFSKENQNLIQKKQSEIRKINHASQNKLIATLHKHEGVNRISEIIIFGGFLIAIFTLFISFFNRKKIILASTSTISLLILTLIACSDSDSETLTDNDTNTTIPSNDIVELGNLFGNFSDVTTSFDDTYFYVSSTGIPEHNMMVGITSWQQQVPIPQDYTGSNSWSFPLQPVLAETPLLASEHFMKGAMAIAINGIPIFNPLNNRGEDAFLFGELDDWGGHCGKADDYHYHIPPTHLESIVGDDAPIAYALDGFPVYGETTDELDEYLGKFNEDGSYQYHTTTTAPYFMAGVRGVVSLDPNTTAPEDQIIPQALSTPIRGGDYGPLSGAEITNFSLLDINSYSLEYQIDENTLYTNYRWNDGVYIFDYIDADGSITTETY